MLITMNQPTQVRLQDVAREAGVSTATVSHVLNGKGRIPESTRARIRDIAERMGYRPNAAARSLASGRTGLIALAFSLPAALPVPLTDVDYFSRAIRAATSRALERGYALVIGPPTPETTVWSRIPFDGVVVFDPVANDPTVVEFRQRRVPMVLSGRDPGGGNDFCVDNDHLAGTRLVLDHLEACGAQRIALLAGDTQDAYSHDCVQAYQHWCGEHDREPMTTMVPLGRMRRRDEADRVLAQSNPPDAVYATDEVLAVALLDAARARELNVPRDVMIVAAADRQPEPPAQTPSLTTLEMNAVTTAERSIDVLVDVIEAKPPANRMLLIPTELVLGESTAMSEALR